MYMNANCLGVKHLEHMHGMKRVLYKYGGIIIIIIMAPFEEEGVYCFANVGR